MLSIISDIHLTDGSSGETINHRAFNIYKKNLEVLLAKSDCIETKIPELTIVLLGDILDIIRSEIWLENKVRPWDDLKSDRYFNTVDEIVDKIIRYNKYSCKVFNELRNNFFVNGKKVKVDIFYMVGNHDWMFHIADSRYNSIRQKVCDAFHLSNDFTKAFPFNSEENEILHQVLKKHKVFARHGDLFDQYNFQKDRNKSSLGDAVVIDIITKFAYDLKRKKLIKDEVLYRKFVKGLKELDNVKPAYHMKIWLDNLINQSFEDRDLKRKVQEEWKDLISDFFKIPYVKKQNNVFNLVDQIGLLKLAFRHSKLVGFASKWISIDLPNWLNAVQEDAIKNKEANFVVYGHTHSYKVEPLAKNTENGEAKSQFYINTGTWRPIHKLNKADIIKNSFSSFKMMTFTVFYLPEENKDDFEVWTGYLG